MKPSQVLHVVLLLNLLQLELAEARLERRSPGQELQFLRGGQQGQLAAVSQSLLQRGQPQKQAPSAREGRRRRRAPIEAIPDLTKEPALVQIKSVHRASEHNQVPDASFFYDFTDGESTFDADGSRSTIEELGGFEGFPAPEADLMPTIQPIDWFHETESAGATEAWQTYGPNSKDARPYSAAPAWYQTADGRVRQQWYTRDPAEVGLSNPQQAAVWFDTEVDQYDGFGRPRAPSELSEKYYAEWQEVVRTVNLTCGPPGCTANAILEVFDNTSETEYALCRLSVLVHATDFDDQYSNERIEWLVVNGREVLRDFSPRTPKGCSGNGSTASSAAGSEDASSENASSRSPSPASNSSGNASSGNASAPNASALLALPNSSNASETSGSNSSGGEAAGGNNTQQTSGNASKTSGSNSSVGEAAGGNNTRQTSGNDSSESESSQNNSVGAAPITSRLPLYPCVQEFPLQGLLGADGKLSISGKISPAVDECPVDGNHLSGVVVATCFARPIPPPLPPLPTEEPEVALNESLKEFKTHDALDFSCKNPGCNASAVLFVDNFNESQRTCKLTVRINQTDFDEADGTLERIEWVQVNGKNVSTNVTPGKNPCEEARESGSARKHEVFTVLDNEDVTEALENGTVTVAMKISDMVDECGVHGHLLAGRAEVICN